MPRLLRPDAGSPPVVVRTPKFSLTSDRDPKSARHGIHLLPTHDKKVPYKTSRYNTWMVQDIMTELEKRVVSWGSISRPAMAQRYDQCGSQVNLLTVGSGCQPVLAWKILSKSIKSMQPLIENGAALPTCLVTHSFLIGSGVLPECPEPKAGAECKTRKHCLNDNIKYPESI
jgi:hypothetical protein